MAIALDWHEKTPQTAWSEGLQRSARDSNPQALSGARFRGECITILPALRGTELEASRLRVQECLWLPGSAQRASCGVGQPINRGAWGSFMTINRGARIRTGDLCDPNAALYRTEPHPGQLGYLLADGVGFEPTRTMSTRFPIVRLKPLGHPSKRGRIPALHDRKRREWDSNPRGASTNALAGRRLKPLGHPSPGVRSWWNLTPSCPARART